MHIYISTIIISKLATYVYLLPIMKAYFVLMFMLVFNS